MKFGCWSEHHNFGTQDIADMLGRTPGLIHKWLHNNALPSPEAMREIYALTHGRVTPNDFYDLPEVHDHPRRRRRRDRAADAAAARGVEEAAS